MAVFVGIHFPKLPLEVFRPCWSHKLESGYVIVDHDAAVIVDEGASRAGVRVGMKRGGVMTLMPNATFFERDPLKEQDLQKAAATALMQFTPCVVIEPEQTLIMDVTASLRLFGGILRLCQLIRKTIQAIGLTATVSTAPTGQGAWILSKLARSPASAVKANRPRILKLKSLERVLNRCPYALLPEMRSFSDWFTGIGCRTLEDIQKLPRAGLKRRCGVGLLDSLDRAYGLAPEMYEWLELPLTFSARLELPDRAEGAAMIEFAARRLVLQLCGWLSTQRIAASHIILSLEHERRGRNPIEPTLVEIALAAATWVETHLMRLIKERLNSLELDAPVVAVCLAVMKVEDAQPVSDTLFPEPSGSVLDHVRLIELLTARLGHSNVLRSVPVSDHRPEHANQWRSIQDAEKPDAIPSGLPRPMWLLEKPVQLMVKNHRPFYGSALTLVSPSERIENGWFDGNLITRDYFVAEGADSTCYWIFRERPGSIQADKIRWFLHGLFG